jgi:hypothetical protein
MASPLIAPVLATALVLGAASADAQLKGVRQFPVTFVEPDTLRLEFYALQAGEDVRLTTKGTDTVRARLRVLDAGGGRPLSRLLALPQDKLFSPGNTLLELRSAAIHDSLIAGEYSGTVQLLDRDGKLVGERPLLVTVPALVRPAERQWAATVYKFTVFSAWRAGFPQQSETRCAPRDSSWTARFPDPRPAPCVRDNVLPLRLAARDARYVSEAFRVHSKPVLLGVIENEKAQDHAMVWWTGNPLGSPPRTGSPGVEMQFVGMDEPGVYTGNIQLPPEAGSGTVALVVKVTHHWTLVLLPIMLGVALSMWLRRYVRKRQAVLSLRERSTQLVVRAEHVDRRLAQLDDEVEDAARLRVDVAVTDRLRQADRRIRALALSRAPAERNDAERDAVDAEVTALEAALVGWEELVDALQRVGRLLGEFDDLTARLPARAGLGDVPAVRTTAVAVLKAAVLDTDAAVHARCTLATQQADLLEWWSGLAEEAVRLGAGKGRGGERRVGRALCRGGQQRAGGSGQDAAPHRRHGPVAAAAQGPVPPAVAPAPDGRGGRRGRSGGGGCGGMGARRAAQPAAARAEPPREPLPLRRHAGGAGCAQGVDRQVRVRVHGRCPGVRRGLGGRALRAVHRQAVLRHPGRLRGGRALGLRHQAGDRCGSRRAGGRHRLALPAQARRARRGRRRGEGLTRLVRRVLRLPRGVRRDHADGHGGPGAMPAPPCRFVREGGTWNRSDGPYRSRF